MKHRHFKDLTDLIDIANVETKFRDVVIPELFTTHEDNLMTQFTSALVAGIFRHAYEKMVILRGMFRVRGFYPQEKMIIYKNLKERFEHRDAEDNIPLEDLNYFKLQKEINVLMIIWKEACMEIKEFGTYLNAAEMVEVLNKHAEDEKRLVSQEPINKKKMHELRTKVARDKEYYLKAIDETVKEIHILKFTLEDVKAYSMYELNYLNEYEDARIEQNSLSFLGKEKELQSYIDEMKVKINDENLVHELMSSYMEESKDDYLADIDYWTKYYETELETYENQIMEIKTKIERTQENVLGLRRDYEKREAQIKEWLEYMEKTKEKERQEALELWSSLTIQVWWRYVMKKLKLGPFKKKGKGKK